MSNEICELEGYVGGCSSTIRSKGRCKVDLAKSEFPGFKIDNPCIKCNESRASVQCEVSHS